MTEIHIPADQAELFLENCEKYINGNPMNEDEWSEILDGLEAIRWFVCRALEQAGITSEWDPKNVNNNPYIIHRE